MEIGLQEELLAVIALRRPLPILEIRAIYKLTGSIDKCIKCIDASLRENTDPRELARLGNY